MSFYGNFKQHETFPYSTVAVGTQGLKTSLKYL